MINNWNNIYSNSDGNKVNDPIFYSEYGSFANSDGSRMNPFNGMDIKPENNAILGNGVFHLNNGGYGSYASKCIVGTNKRTSFLNINDSYILEQTLKNVTLEASSVDLQIGKPSSNSSPVCWLNCIVKRNIKSYAFKLNSRNCLMLGEVLDSYSLLSWNTTFVNSFFSTSTNEGVLSMGSGTHLNVFHNCKITITKAPNYKFTAFSSCSFLIGSEKESKPLVGNNSDELLADYIARCEAQSIDTTNIDYFFIFSNSSLDDQYRIRIESEIDLFGLKKGVYFGYEQPAEKGILIQEDMAAQSFNNIEGVSKGIVIENDIITLNQDADISLGATKQSTLLVFDKVKSISKLGISFNLPNSAFASTARPLYKVAIDETIKQGINYLVGSNNGAVATVMYNDVIYSSDKSTNNNIFRGVDGFTKLEDSSENTVLYMITDYVGIPSIGIRTMIQPLRDNVTNKNIRKGYWYLVAQGSIKYNGINYLQNSSFLANDETTYTDLGDSKVHEVFIDDEEQNPFVDVFVNKPTAAMSNFSTIVKDSTGVLVGSSNPSYTEFIDKGYIECSLQGKIIQLKTGIITKNG